MRRTPLFYTILLIELIVGVILVYNFTYLTDLLSRRAGAPSVTAQIAPTLAATPPITPSITSSVTSLPVTVTEVVSIPIVTPASFELSPAVLSVFAILPREAPSEAYESTEALVNLGRMLFYDPRLSATQDMSCNTCHALDKFGVDGLTISAGHDGRPVQRNSPTVYNAAFHMAQFWDGRASTVEEQAIMPILSKDEMGINDSAALEKVLRSIPGYPAFFAAAFPGDPNPITHQNVGMAIGAFERRLNTPARFDQFLAGDNSQLDANEQRGLITFINLGCTQCHMGVTVGGLLYKKLGEIEPYPTEDVGRFAITGLDEDKYVFKVPSLRNVAKTGPYLHDGSIETLEEMVRLMARHQLGKQVTDNQVTDVVTFLNALTGDIPTAYIASPQLPESGPDTPRPKRVN